MKMPVPTALVSVAGAALIGLLIYGVSHQAANRSLDEALAHGKHPLAPYASKPMPELSGAGQSTLAAYRGKVVVLNFFASWCVSCQEESPLLERTQHQLQRHGATILGITYQDDASKSKEYLSKYGLTYPALRDASGEMANAYGTRQIPESFLIGREGRIYAIERGPIGAGFARQALQLAEGTPG
jgi:cytochrome c biogenesis protein CcmG/thiol:disulfide interchange protein DsbE